MRKTSFLTAIFAQAFVFCAISISAHAQSNQLLNLPLPPDGFRYHSQSELEFQWPANHGEGSVCLWGGDKFAAVSFTIDDNTSPDWPFWRQASATYGWKFTWFVIVHPYVWDVYNNLPGSNPTFSGTPAQWKEMNDEGYDIQLHGNTDMNGLLDPAYEEQMILASAFMESVISNRMDCFAYPGGVPAGGIPPGVDRIAIARRNMTAARGGTGYAIAKPAIIDYSAIPAIGPAMDLSASGYWAKMDQTNNNLLYSSYRGWAVVLNHGVNETGTIAVLNFLKTNEHKYWVQPFSTVAHYGQERDSATLNVTTVTATQIEFTLTDLMSDEHFDTPLTVKFRVDDWGGATASQNGQAVPVRVTNYNGNAYALVDAVPDKGPVTLSKSASAGFTASPASGWNPLTVLFSGTSTFTGITNRFWDFGDGAATNTAATNLTHTYTVDGTYTVQLIVSGAEGVYTNTQVNLISVATPVVPSAGFSVSTNSGSAPLLVGFTDTSSGTITNRYWDFGDGVTLDNAAASVGHIYTVTGTNTVRLIVSGPAGVSTNTQTAAVIVTAPAPPTASFNASPVSGTTPMVVTFTDTSTGSITNRSWNFGDGTITNTAASFVTHTYTFAGTYTVGLTVSGPAGLAALAKMDLISVVSGVSGSLVAYDPFDSEVTAPMTAGWAPPGWTTDGSAANSSGGYIKSGTMSWPGLAASSGNSFGLGARTDDYFLSFPAVTLAVGDTVYFSFIEKYNVIPASTVTGVGGFVRLANSADAVSTTKGICISRGSVGTPAASNAGFAIATGNKTFGVSPAVSTAGTYDMLATYFIVGSYTRGTTATDGTLKLRINPDSATFGTANPPAPTLSMASVSSADTFNQLRIGSNGSGSHPTDWQIDEVRVGTDWISVAPSENSAPPSTDDDSDGLPNDWEAQHFGGSTNANPDSMAANGLNTVLEAYVAGLNPTNPASRFAVSNHWNTLHWTAASGRVYSVFRSTNLLNGFQPLETNLVWPQNSWTDAVHEAQADGFYRIGARLAP